MVAAVHGHARRHSGMPAMSRSRIFSSETVPARRPRVALSTSSPTKIEDVGSRAGQPLEADVRRDVTGDEVLHDAEQQAEDEGERDARRRAKTAAAAETSIAWV